MKFLLISCLIFLSNSYVSACEFTMGYRTSERLPFINKAPDNQGLYHGLFQLAANSIGCKLKTVRAPKKRILKMLAQGDVDFYPGLGKTKAREQYLYFFENGLTSHTVAISHQSEPDIETLAQMRGKVLLIAIGGNDFDANKHGIYLRKAHDLSVPTALTTISDRKADFFLYNKDSLLYYLHKHPDKSLKIHPCCFKPKAMLLGFSKKSKHLTFTKAKGGSLQLAKDSKAYLFQQALQKIQTSETLNELKNYYFH
ncbi:transporter substrate-binding domain-containing protein [Litorilituus sediminis]|uniref:Transporter substrate-binding domain-containing protein n=2 Tax=Litorilituus sediminis TaxID=718192 RepID=A0A4P6P856_9GAMM|nr:transporter substrate-binding domain-containing protein [Litorilituus sediminis]